MSRREKHEFFREGEVHVLKDKCSSCIFRKVNDGRILGLRPGRVAGMVLGARTAGSVIPCHQTIRRHDVRPAICRGYWDLPVRVQLLQIAERLGLVVFDAAPPHEG